MKETAQAFFILDDHTSGAALPAGPVQLKGWAVAKPSYFITDLRIKVGRRIFPATYGHPRPDLAQYFKAREPFLLAGFEGVPTLELGENQLEFEACEITGHWLPLATIVLIGTSPAIATAPQPLADSLKPHEFARALRLVLQRSANESADHSAARSVNLLPLPHVTRYPSLPFHGHLHHPPSLQRTEFGRVIVEGWLFHEAQKILRVAASVDLHGWQILAQEGAFPYVAGLFPQFPQAAACRFHGAIDVPAQLPQPVSVRLYAELDDGSWHLCHVERSYLYGDEQYKAPYVRFSPFTFVQGIRALRNACLNRGLNVPLDGWFFKALREVWSEYRARAPRRTPLALPESTTFLTAHSKPLPLRVTLITHNLNFEGAPLFLLEYASHLASQGVTLTVISAANGPLHDSFSALGAKIQYADISPLLTAKNARELRAALATLSSQIDLSEANLVVANTLSTYWGIHLANRAGKRSLFYIHESTTPDTFYFGYMASDTLPVVKEAFELASHVSFLTEATRRYYLPNLLRPNHSINPGWIDLARIEHFKKNNPRAELRARLKLEPSTRLIVNVGTVCNRKGQHIFVRAVDLFWRRHPELAAQCKFLMIGGRDSAYDAAINRLVCYFNRPNLRVVTETPTPQLYYGAADLFVCSSYEESFPRVLLEAMAFAVPIVSTNVHGIPEMARAETEAVLVTPGDSSALADAMSRVLTNNELAQSLSQHGLARVTACYGAATLLPHHASLASVIAENKTTLS